jgi:hypothetical protein
VPDDGLASRLHSDVLDADGLLSTAAYMADLPQNCFAHLPLSLKFSTAIQLTKKGRALPMRGLEGQILNRGHPRG